MDLSLDFETGSECNLLACGVHLYARHESTHALVASYSFDHGLTIKRWQIWLGELVPADLRAALRDPAVRIHAWNAEFERLILRDVLGLDLPPERFTCTMTQARAMALPGKLDHVARALKLPHRKLSNRTMLKWCKPLKTGGWAEDPIEFGDLCLYCDRDVEVEAAAGRQARQLSTEEQLDYIVNADINQRGIMIDRALAQAAQRYALEEIADISRELAQITDGEVTTAKQFARIKAWLQPRLPDAWKLQPDERGKISFDRRAREELLDAPADDFDPAVRDFIELVDDAGRASTAKFKAMDQRADPQDDRVRGCFILNGAGQTGRFSAQGLQPQNMIRAMLPDPEAVIGAILAGAPHSRLVELARDSRKPGEPDLNVLTILSRCLRPAIIADQGKRLIWSDWSAIEARINPWLSLLPSAEPLLQAFREGQEIYIRQALATFHCRPEEVTDERRQIGKVQILAFGFGGGVGAMMAMARAYGITMNPALADNLKHAWRVSNPWGPEFWAALEAGVVQAVLMPGSMVSVGRIKYYFDRTHLWCALPSGRLICYPFAAIETIEGFFGPQDAVMALKGSRLPPAGSNTWPRMQLWGGILCENIVQGEAASLLRWLLRELYHQLGDRFDVIAHSHDEVIREVPEHLADEAQALLHQLMVTGPSWAAGLPLAAETAQGYAYKVKS